MTQVTKTAGGLDELAKEEARRAAMGRHLRALRKERRWLQETLAREADISVATIRAIENHAPGRHPTRRTLEKLSHALRLPSDYLSVYLEKAPLEDSAGEPEASAAPRRSPGDLVVSRLDEIIVARLREIVVPHLENVEGQVRALMDVKERVSEPRRE